MYLVLIIIRFLLGSLSGGLRAVRAGWPWQPFQDGLVPVRAALRDPVFPGIVWMHVRPVLKRLGAPPDCYRATPVASDGGGGRWLVGHLPGAAGPFPTASHYRPVLT